MTNKEETIKALRARIMGLERENRELKEQNKRYKQALEFYADRENYKPDQYDPDTHDYMSMIDRDRGATARKALEGENETD